MVNPIQNNNPLPNSSPNDNLNTPPPPFPGKKSDTSSNANTSPGSSSPQKPSTNQTDDMKKLVDLVVPKVVRETMDEGNKAISKMKKNTDSRGK